MQILMFIHYFAETNNGETHVFTNIWNDVTKKHPFFIDALKDDTVYAKIICIIRESMLENFKNHLQIFEDIGDLNITLSLIKFKLFPQQRKNRISIYYTSRMFWCVIR